MIYSSCRTSTYTPAVQTAVPANSQTRLIVDIPAMLSLPEIKAACSRGLGFRV